jgi:hypothetical protein
MTKAYIITSTRPMSGRTYDSRPLTIAEAVDYYGYTLEVGASWAHEKGNKKINRNPRTIKSLLANLNNASNNAARNGCGDYYTAVEA